MLGIDLQQIFLHLLNFGILFFGLYFILYNPVKKFMEKRMEYYKNMDAEAQTKLAEANALKAEHEEDLRKFKSEVNAKRAEAEKELNAYRESQTQAADATAKKIIRDAKDEALRERKRIIDQSSAELTELAVQTANRIVKASVSDSYNRFLNDVEKESVDEQ